MAWTTPKTWTAGSVLTAAELNEQIRDNFGAAFVTPTDPTAAWTAFTPTLSGGWALGNSTYVATYMKIGRQVTFSAVITVGSSATKGTTLTAALPVTAASASGLVGIRCWGEDAGTADFMFDHYDTTTTTITFGSHFVSGTTVLLANVTSTAPFTWATGDKIGYGGTYEAAS